MKKLFTILILFCFVFTVTAAYHVQSKTPEKPTTEKTVLKAEAVAIVSLRSEQNKVIDNRSSDPNLPCKIEANYNYKEHSNLGYVADISREYNRQKSQFSITL